MLSVEKNERLTRVGPGTPMGKLMRCYWHPIAAASMLDQKNPVKGIRILGEDLVLFRDKQGQLGLVDHRCAHRRVELKYGYVAEEGLRCPYHAWTYDVTGQCTAMPAEPVDSTYKCKIKLKSYPVQELAGLVFAYLGTQPAPLLPRWEPLVTGNALRQISVAELPCNWLQTVENSPDWLHTEWLHGHYAKAVLEQRGVPEDDPLYQNTLPLLRHVAEFDNEPFKYGILRRTRMEGGSRNDELWSVGNPILLPNSHLVSGDGQMYLVWRVPVDDTHTIQWGLQVVPFEQDIEVPHQDSVPHFDIPLKDQNGEWNLHVSNTQDHMVMVTQGEILDRTQEHLAQSDKGIVLYRNMLLDQVDIVEKGGEPMNVFREPKDNVLIKLPIVQNWLGLQDRDGQYRKGALTRSFGVRYSPLLDLIDQIAERAMKKRLAGEKAETDVAMR